MSTEWPSTDESKRTMQRLEQDLRSYAVNFSAGNIPLHDLLRCLNSLTGTLSTLVEAGVPNVRFKR